MKKNIFTLSIILILLVLSQVTFAGDTQVNIGPNLEGLSNAPAFYYVYDAPTKKDIADNVKKLWNNLNKHTNAQLDLNLLNNAEISDRISVNTNGIIFDVFSPAAPGFLYTKSLTNYLRPANKETKSNRLPDKYQSVEIARDYLSKLEILPQETEELYIAKVNKVCMASYNSKTKESQAYDVMQVVHFGRKLNGIPVYGASRIVVRLGDNDELVGVIKNWPKLIPKEIKSKAEIHEKSKWKDVAAKHLKDLYVAGDFSAVNIEKAEVVMYDDGEGCIEPALFVKGKQIGKSGFAAEGDWVIPIMAEPKAKYKAAIIGSRNQRGTERIR